MSELLISAVICTHNPRPDYLARTLQALKSQTLPPTDWELVIVDNGSRSPVGPLLDLSWHPQARVVIEEKLGLTHARICGVRTTRAPLIVYIDDDNLLAPDYLAQAAGLGGEFPQLGIWGAGRITPEYETAPAPELAPFCQSLALKEIRQDLWSNAPVISDALPYGAGIVLRRAVGEAYAASKAGGGMIFGRSGTSLLSSEDYEMDFMAADQGWGYGVFRRLALVHLIPAGRVRRDYLLQLWETINLSTFLLLLLRQETEGAARFGFAEIAREFLGPLFKVVRGPEINRAFFLRVLAGKWKALRLYHDRAARRVKT
jgi:hypothetical protein